MQTIHSFKIIPFVIVAICFLAFGVLIPYLGFYQDDWHPVFYGFSRGIDRLWELFLYDNRPFASIIYIIGFSLLGFKPFFWQLLAFILRTLTVIVTWTVLVELWPNNKRQASWIALLFAVYPLFDLQPLALIYTIQWTGFLLFSFSIWAMLRSVHHSARFLFYTILSLIAGAAHLIVIEYYIGLELVRPVLIWISLPGDRRSNYEKLRKVLKIWAPYAGILIGYIIFRVFFIPRPPTGFERNAPWLLINFIDQPIPTFVHFLESLFKDMVIVIGAAWNNLISPEIIGFSKPANLIAIVVAILASTGLYFVFKMISQLEEPSPEIVNSWTKSAFTLGLFMVIFAPIPGWLTNQFISTKNQLWSSRFGLAAMIGASILIVALMEFLISNHKYRTIVYCTLIGLSVGWHFLNANDFRWAWQKQVSFYHQLKWRAPDIKPDTAILADIELFPRMGEYPTSFALNTLYSKGSDETELDYWFFGLYRKFNEQRDELKDGTILNDKQFSSNFSSQSLDSLIVDYKPELNQCLWVLNTDYENVYAIPEISRELAQISNPKRILAEHDKKQKPVDEILGSEKQNQWCYFYQRADLAKQIKDWEGIKDIWNGATEAGYKPPNGVEYLPFIEGLAMVGDWEQAAALSRRANQVTPKMKPVLCEIWKRLERESLRSQTGSEAIRKSMDKLNCR